MMKAFYKKRLSSHQTKLIRYLKYVFNDHVVLILSFSLGGFGLYYSNFVKTLDSSFTLGKPLILLIWLGTLFIGKLATLVKPPDTVFLLPKENQMVAYFKASLAHSLVLPLLTTFLVTGLTMPLLVAINRATVADFIGYVLLLWVLKTAQLFSQCHKLFLTNQTLQQKSLASWLLVTCLALFSSLFVSLGLAVLLAGALAVYQYWLLRQAFSTKNLAWETMIADEQQRLKRIYQFINLFTDVPGITGKVKRRKIVDPLLNKLTPQQANTFFYLYSRNFIRTSEYSGLVWRLTVIGSLGLIFLTDFWLVLIVSLLIIYLIGFQLIPIYSQFDYMILTQLYPVPAEQKKQAVYRLMQYLLFSIATLFSLIVLIVLPVMTDALIVIASLMSEVTLFIAFYVPSRLKKISNF